MFCVASSQVITAQEDADVDNNFEGKSDRERKMEEFVCAEREAGTMTRRFLVVELTKKQKECHNKTNRSKQKADDRRSKSTCHDNKKKKKCVWKKREKKKKNLLLKRKMKLFLSTDF